MPNPKRQFAMIEIYIWKDPVFKVLSESARMLWLHLMTSPKTTKLPGLLQASILTVMSDIGWDRPPEGGLRWSEQEILARGIQRIKQSFAILEQTRHRSNTPWVMVDRDANLIILPRKIAHNLPLNPNIIQGWINELKEVPPSVGRDNWITNTFGVLRRAFGRNDNRVKLLSGFERKARKRLGEGGVLGWCDDLGDPEQFYNHELQLKQRKDLTSLNNSESKRKTVSKDLDHRSEILDLRIGGKAGAHAGTPANGDLDLKFEEPADPKPPSDASARLVAIWNAMQTETFLVPGFGDQTMWNNTKHPETLAKKLDTGAPAVDIAALIRSLAGWTYANPKKAKKDLGRFVWNAAARDQDKPKSSQTQRTSTTLADKVGRSRGGG